MTPVEAQRFFKLEALANDFVLVDARAGRFDPDAEQVRSWADRRTGIGFDQLLVLKPEPSALARVEIRNADGSSAEQCGNGMRAIAAWLEQRGELGAGAAELLTPAGPVEIARAGDGLFSAVLPGPTALDPNRLGLEPPACDDGLRAIAVSMGNPHLILITEREPTAASLQAAVAGIGRHGGWRDAANISLAKSRSDDSIELRVHERGVGPTAACGSAACAAAWVAAEAGNRDGPIEVRQPGGSLVIDFDRDSGRVQTIGPARLVFEGRIR